MFAKGHPKSPGKLQTVCNNSRSGKLKSKKCKRYVDNKPKPKKNTVSTENLDYLHKKFVHINSDYINTTAKYKAVNGLPRLQGEQSPCEACWQAKTRRVSFKLINPVNL